MNHTILVGHLIKVFGKNGYLKLSLEQEFINDVLNSRYLIVRKYGEDIPYFIEDLDTENSLIKFESIANPEDAKFISDCPVYLFDYDITNKPLVNHQDNQLIKGFEIKDQGNQTIGHVLEVVEMPMQVLLKVDHLGEEVLLPFHEDLIISVDMDTNVICLKITDGLLDL